MKTPRPTREGMSPHERRVHLATKDPLRTGELAEILAMVGRKTGEAAVRDAIDAGALPGRRIPGSKFRVTDRAKLDAWFRGQGIDASPVTPTTLVLAERNGDDAAFTDLGGGRVACYDTFTLAQLMLSRPVVRLVIEQSRDDVTALLEAIGKTCAGRRYPMPALEIPSGRAIRTDAPAESEPAMAGG